MFYGASLFYWDSIRILNNEIRVMEHEQCMMFAAKSWHAIAGITNGWKNSQIFYWFYNTKSFDSDVWNSGPFEFPTIKFRVTFSPELTMPEFKYQKIRYMPTNIRHLKREYPGRCSKIGNEISIEWLEIKHSFRLCIYLKNLC